MLHFKCLKITIYLNKKLQHDFVYFLSKTKITNKITNVQIKSLLNNYYYILKNFMVFKNRHERPKLLVFLILKKKFFCFLCCFSKL